MKYRLIGAIGLAAGCLLHLFRSFSLDVSSYLPHAGSLLFLVALPCLAALYIVHWQADVPYVLTTVLFVLAALVHLLRFFFVPELLVLIPQWVSWFLAPLAGWLAWENWKA
ncbi:MAG: hypothetical protein OXR66_00560 [Candidatus Woesearchaeota archaeon]|nr:hypothetical protein [Candidatus Woesearchaeota archaeon]